jgi:hypothetical protein
VRHVYKGAHGCRILSHFPKLNRLFSEDLGEIELINYLHDVIDGIYVRVLFSSILMLGWELILASPINFWIF